MPSGYQKVSFGEPLALSPNDDVWLVQIPNSVDITDAKVVSEHEIQVGSTTFALRPTDMPVGDCQVLIPDTESVLHPTGTKPSKIMVLTKRVGLPKIDYDQVRTPKPVVEQVKNMRMRHFPTGYSAKAFGITSDSPRKVKEPKVESSPSKSKDKSKSKSKDKKDKKDKKEKKDKKSK